MISYTRELVRAKIKQSFPPEDSESIHDILDLYGKESYERERERVQIAILKLSEGDIGKLHINLEIAKRDYRDVLAYAEYPEEMTTDPGKTGSINVSEEIKRLRERDSRQYLEWLGEII